MWAGEALDLSFIGRFQGPTTGTGGLRFRFRVYSVLQTKKAIEKEGGRVSKCVHPDTTVILANWILLDCTLCNRGDDFLVSPQVAFTQISSVQGWFPKVVKKKTLLAPKKYPARFQEVWCRYMIDISWYIYISMYVYKSYRFLYCSVYISIMNMCINYSIVFQPGQPWEKGLWWAKLTCWDG